MDMRTTLGSTLREARLRAGLTLREIAEKIGISQPYLSDIEHDRRIPAERVLQQLAHELGLSFDDLMSMAGRFGESVEYYLRQYPAAGLLFRRIAEKRLPEEDLKELLRQVENMSSRRG